MNFKCVREFFAQGAQPILSCAQIYLWIIADISKKRAYLNKSELKAAVR